MLKFVRVGLAVIPASFLFVSTLWALAPASQPATPSVGMAAPDFTLKSLAGDDVSLSASLADGPVVLVMLRGWPGYQCPICTKQVGELIGAKDAFATHHARVILVYPGPAENLKAHAQEFADGKGIPAGFSFVMDPDYTFTDAYNLRWDKNGETAYPSTFVIDGKGIVRWELISKSHGGRATSKQIEAALTKLR